MRPALADQLGPNRIAPLDFCLSHPTPSTTDVVAVVPDFSFRVRHHELQMMAFFHAWNH
jgi:hypothetical protein